jgi:hypothetical protein
MYRARLNESTIWTLSNGTIKMMLSLGVVDGHFPFAYTRRQLGLPRSITLKFRGLIAAISGPIVLLS